MSQTIEYDPLASVGPEYFEVMANQRLTWVECLGELIDNAFDAQADRVVIQFGGKSLKVADNGYGCDDITKMLSLGLHYVPPGKSHGRIGRWGVGLKDAATWLWGTTEIESRYRDEIVRGAINWPLYTKQRDRKLSFTRDKAEEDDLVGTIITFKNIDRRYPDFQLLITDLSYLFSPGLQTGKQIIVIQAGHKYTCPAWKLPPFEGAAISETFYVDNRKVILTAGVVADGHPNERKGYSLFYGNRIIKSTTTWANGGNSLARFCATIELDSKWTLGKNKTDIKESMMDELEVEVYKRCELVIARAAKQSTYLKNTILDRHVQELLQANIDSRRIKAGEKEMRDKGNQHGTVEPKDTKRERKPKKVKPGGDRISRVSAINFEWEDAKNGLIGRAEFGKNQCTVWLNQNHPHLIYLREQENSDAIAALCWVVMAEHSQNVDGSLFKYIAKGESVIDTLSKYLIGYEKAVKKERAS